MLFDIIGISLIEQFSEHVVLDNYYKAVGCDGCTDLYSDSVLSSSPEFLNLEVLLEPLEELYLPAVLVEVGDLQCGQFHDIGQEHEFSVLLLII